MRRAQKNIEICGATHHLPQDDEFDKRDNLQTALRARGYRTGVAGKWHLSLGGSKRWSQYQKCVEDVKETGWTFADGLYMADIERYFGFSHNPEWVSDRALSFIQDSVTARSPFLLYYNPTLPHGPPAAKALAVPMRNTPSGQLDRDPVSGMPDRKVRNKNCFCCYGL